MIQRYNIFGVYGPTVADENENGEWVKYADHIAALSAAEPAGWQWRHPRATGGEWMHCPNGPRADKLSETEYRPVYATPPAPSVAVKALDFDAVYVIPREMSDEEWAEVKYNVDRKANPDIELWRIKEAVKYANFIAGHRGRSALSAQVQDVAIPEGWQLVPIDRTPEMIEASTLDSPYGVSNKAWSNMLAASPAKQEG